MFLIKKNSDGDSYAAPLQQFYNLFMSKAARNIAVGVSLVAASAIAYEVYNMAQAAKALDVNPGKLKIGVPFNSYNTEAKKMETFVPLTVTALLTNQTGTALSFGHPVATVNYRNKSVAVSEAETQGHTLGAFAKKYPLTLQFNVNLEKLGDSVKDAAQYFTARLLGQQKEQRAVRVKLDITAYGLSFSENLDYKI